MLGETLVEIFEEIPAKIFGGVSKGIQRGIIEETLNGIVGTVSGGIIE